MRFLLPLLFLLSCAMLQAQSADSVAKALEANDTLSDGEKATQYRKLAEGFIQGENPDFDKYIQLALEHARKAKDMKEVGYAYLIWANHCYMLGQFEKASTYFTKVGAAGDSLNNPWFHLVKYNGLGVVYYAQSNLDSALTCYLRAKQVALESGDTANGVSILINIGGILRDIGQNDSAETVYETAAELALKNGHKAFEMQAYINLSNISLLNANYPRAHIRGRRSYLLANEVGDPYYISEAQKVYGLSVFWLDTLSKARHLIGKSLQYNMEVGNAHGESDALRCVVLVQAKAGEVDSALQNLSKSRSLDSTAQNRLLLQQSRAKIYELAGQYSKALKAYRVYKSVYDSLINEESLEKLSQIQERFESEQKQRVIAEQTSAIQLAELQLARRNILVGLLIAGLLIAVVAFFGLYQRRKRKLQSEKDAAVIEERERGLEAVIMAQENERRRIGADLHDGITQNLGAISLKIQHLSSQQKDAKNAEALEGLNDILNSSIAEVRTLSHQMRPYALENSGLTSALEMLLENTLRGTAIEAQFEELRAKERYPEKVEITLYRIAQELLNNTIKHSGATLVSLQLIDTKNYLLLIVEDNGKGMSSEDQDSGQGLLNIKSRLNSLHGDIDLNPSSSAGTSVMVRVPLQAEAA